MKPRKIRRPNPVDLCLILGLSYLLIMASGWHLAYARYWWNDETYFIPWGFFLAMFLVNVWAWLQLLRYGNP